MTATNQSTMYRLIVALAFIAFSCQAQQPAPPQPIRLNQVGFYPDAPKIAIVLSETATAFSVRSAHSNEEIYKGTLGPVRTSSYSPQRTRVADFSAVRAPGHYVVVVAGVGQSPPFEIRAHVLDGVTRASIKSYYYQRMSMPLDEKFAGPWKRKAGHPDREVLVHAAAASPGRPAGTRIAAPRGWYDAGDYNKYIVNSGITMGTLLSAYEDAPRYYDTLGLGIPESTNSIPDLLDEILWNLRWMLAMQDPADGGVYHKLTNAAFDGMVMPHEATKPRYVVQKSTAAALDFAAVMAQAARVFKSMNASLPGLTDSCRTAAARAWAWAQKNPALYYEQNAMNKAFDPDVSTGAYGDRNTADEFFWAACELFVTTSDTSYLASLQTLPPMAVPSWSQVQALGYYTLLRFGKNTSALSLQEMRRVVLEAANALTTGIDTRTYATPMGGSARDFIWGSSSVAANQGILLLQAYQLSGDKRYRDYALANADYLLGRNATGYCYVTGFGARQVMHPHHRPSVADAVRAPVPGLLSGGPNPGMQDKCPGYPSSVPDQAFIDSDCSYASNEVAINWNAPLVYLLGMLETQFDSKIEFQGSKKSGEGLRE